MPLPQQVIDRLTHESPRTPGWSVGILLFSLGLLVIALAVYFGITLFYEPYVNGQISSVNAEITAAASSISPSDQTNLAAFYSEVANVQSALANHVYFSHLLTWLGQNTEANVYYTHFTFSSGNQIGLSGVAASEADVNQQMAIFEASPEVSQATISTVSLLQANNTWQFSVTLTMNAPLVFGATVPSSTAASASTTTP
ncbi:MAG TPA: PilN domain-containing protein [Candidatus Paceibacterota bacterium]|jgi:Tfp pilus assembly protein PilN|nr:PilN domain-containing protein [Candidatus Paceibacterota bacterium]